MTSLHVIWAPPIKNPGYAYVNPHGLLRYNFKNPWFKQKGICSKAKIKAKTN